MNDDLINCPDFLIPRLRLFLSADIVGSTALKQSPLGAFADGKSADGASWFTVIQGFYFEAVTALQKEWQLAESACQDQNTLGTPPTLWKTIGDEILFVKELTDHRQLNVALCSWISAVSTIRTFVKRGNPRLDVKCTAWLAGFPFRNREVVLSKSEGTYFEGVDDYFDESGKILNNYYKDPKGSKISIDYIGPSIDIGFRLSGLASSRKFILSVDAAYVVSLTNPTRAEGEKELEVFYDGTVTLKGVFGGLNYPVFWLDMKGNGSLDSFEDKLTGATPCNRDHLRKYCEAFYKEHPSYIFPPFIVSGTEQQIKTVPNWYWPQHDLLRANFSTLERNSPEPEDFSQEIPENIEDLDEDFKKIIADLAVVAETDEQSTD